jgi:hypothetical protein
MLLVQCNPFNYGGALASPGYCLFYLSDTELPAAARMHQFLDRASWREHVNQHIENFSKAPNVHTLECSVLTLSDQRRKKGSTFRTFIASSLSRHPKSLSLLSGEVSAKPPKYKIAKATNKYDLDMEIEACPKSRYEFADETAKLWGQKRHSISSTPSVMSRSSTSITD